MTSWLSLSATIIGICGGLAGLIAFARSESDLRARRSVEHLPPELRPLLLAMLEVSLDLERRSQTNEWVQHELEPLAKQYRPVAHLAASAVRGDFFDIASVTVNLNKLLLCVDSDQEQGDLAHRLTDTTTALLHRMALIDSPLGPINLTSDDVDVVPRTGRGWWRSLGRGIRSAMPSK